MAERNPRIQDVYCGEPGCSASYRNHSNGKIDAHKSGWFFPKNGLAVCPDHNPSWVAGWRARKSSSSN